MNNTATPDLSIVFVTPDRYATIQRAVRSLHSQTIVNQLEIIIVAPSATVLELQTADMQPFLSYQVVEVGEQRSAGFTRVAGMRQSHAAIVAYLEDHAFPASPTWAETLCKTHQQPWGAVAPKLENGNPESLISWTSYLLCFGSWAVPKPPSALQNLPWRNCSYKRSILMEYGDELAEMFISESVLHQELVKKGYQLYIDPDARLHHLNFTHLLPMLREQFFVGRVFGAARMQHWSLLRRLLYVAGAPLIPGIRLWRLWSGMQQILQQHSLMPQIIPSLVLGLLAGCAGEVMGYLSGFGNALEEELTKIEVNSDRQLVSNSSIANS